MAKLVIKSREGKETEYELHQKETRIGRVAPMVDLLIHDGRASRLHAVVKKGQSGYTVVDLNSANGTFVNEKRISEHMLREGETIRIGETTLRFEASRPTTLQVEQVDKPLVSGATVMLVQSDSFKVGRAEKTVTPEEISRLRSRAEILTHMFDLSKTLATVFNVDEIFKHVTDLLFDLTPAARVVAFEMTTATNELAPLVARFRDKDTDVDTENVVVSRTILRKAVDERVSVLVSDAASQFGQSKSVMFQKISSAICAPMVGQSGVLGAIYADVSSTNPLDTFTQDHLELMNAVASQVSVAVENAITHRQLSRAALARAAYERFLPAHVVEQIVDAPDSLKLGGVTQQVTVLFADVCGFTTMSAKAHPEQIVEMLNRLFSVLTEIVFKHEGTLDKYIGDAIMALFGAPYVTDEDAENAALAAIEMRAALDDLNEEFAELGFPRVNLSIGLNTGRATVGYIGSERRTDYTAIGDTVNLAARLQTAAKPGQILASDATVEAIGDQFISQPVGSLKLKGYDKEIGAHEIISSLITDQTISV